MYGFSLFFCFEVASGGDDDDGDDDPLVAAVVDLLTVDAVAPLADGSAVVNPGNALSPGEAALLMRDVAGETFLMTVGSYCSGSEEDDRRFR